MKLNEAQRKDMFYVDPRSLEIENGFNTRIDYGDIDELKNSIIQNGVKNPLKGFKNGDKYVITDGHRRHKAVMMAIEEGHDIARVPLLTEKKKTVEDRMFDILIMNDGKQLTPLELGETYKKLQGFGYSSSEIAEKIGKSFNHVNDMIEVACSPKEIKDEISKGTVSATLVKNVIKKSKNTEDAGKTIKTAIDENKAKGKKKVTKKDIELPAKKGERVYTKKLLIPESEVREYLKKQIEACAANIPEEFKQAVLDTELVY